MRSSRGHTEAAFGPARDPSLSNVWSLPAPYGTLLRMKGAARWIVGGSVVVLALGACRAEDAGRAGSSGKGICGLQVEFNGVTYNGIGVHVAPVPGPVLGSATVPACNDTGNESDNPTETEIAEFPGQSPEDALLWPNHEDVVFVREDLTPIPDAILNLLAPPPCVDEDGSLSLRGEWLGILGPDGKTELDLEPPYDVDLFVTEASDPIYERSFLTVRVPPGLGTPLTHQDMVDSLRRGGGIRIAASCEGDKYIASSIQAIRG